MKRIAYALMALILLSGCALSTIRPPKRAAREPEPVRRTVIEREVYRPAPKPAVKEKEEVMPTKEVVLPTVEEEEEEYIK
jgi:hypothetical protein